MKLVRHKGLIGTKAVAVEARREQRCAEAHGWWEEPFWGSYSFHPPGSASKTAKTTAKSAKIETTESERTQRRPVDPERLTTRIRMASFREIWSRSWTGSAEKFDSSSIKRSPSRVHCRP